MAQASGRGNCRIAEALMRRLRGGDSLSLQFQADTAGDKLSPPRFLFLNPRSFGYVDCRSALTTTVGAYET
jgi:hypothetical protein